MEGLSSQWLFCPSFSGNRLLERNACSQETLYVQKEAMDEPPLKHSAYSEERQKYMLTINSSNSNFKINSSFYNTYFYTEEYNL